VGANNPLSRAASHDGGSPLSPPVGRFRRTARPMRRARAIIALAAAARAWEWRVTTAAPFADYGCAQLDAPAVRRRPESAPIPPPVPLSSPAPPYRRAPDARRSRCSRRSMRRLPRPTHPPATRPLPPRPPLPRRPHRRPRRPRRGHPLRIRRRPRPRPRRRRRVPLPPPPNKPPLHGPALRASDGARTRATPTSRGSSRSGGRRACARASTSAATA
jgi:hypothetical protein